MVGFFESALFKYFVFPIVCAIGTVVFRSITREDKRSSFRSEDWMIGPDLVWLSVTILAAGISDKVTQYRNTQKAISDISRANIPAEQLTALSNALGLHKTAENLISLLSASGFVMFSYVFVAVCISVYVRQFGWEGPSKPYRWRGIILPVLVGFLMLAAAMRFLTLEAFT
jgi:hypothetical protein